jgi:hypothetical protein
MQKALDKDTFLAFVGSPVVWLTFEAGEQPAHRIGRIVSATFLSGLARYESERGGFDYIDLEADPEHTALMPNSFRGVSGGALWRLWVRFDGEPKPENLKLDHFVLAGVVFWEDLAGPEPPWVRSHGPISLYQKLVADLRRSKKS